jgi:putative endonuclease
MKSIATTFYILYSATLDRYYSGITTEEIQTRIAKHNISFHGSHFTSSAKDWELRLLTPCETYNIARKTELYVKRMKSRKFIEKIIQDPLERDILISKIKSN